MGKGTPAQGKKSKGKNHIACRRCGEPAYHVTRNVCASCGYGKSPSMRGYSWQKK